MFFVNANRHTTRSHALISKQSLRTIFLTILCMFIAGCQDNDATNPTSLENTKQHDQSISAFQSLSTGTDFRWFQSASGSGIQQLENGVLWQPVKKPTTLHRYFEPAPFTVGQTISFTMQWESDGVSSKGADKELECAKANPSDQGQGISDQYLRCLAGTGDFRIGLFQSNVPVGNNSCDGNSKKSNCPDGQSETTAFNDYKGFQFRIHPHLSADFANQSGRLKEDKGDGDQESHINISLWSRIEPGENGLMSDECQALDHCGFSKSDEWGTQPQSWGPNVPFGESRELHFTVTRNSNTDYQVYVTLNNNTAPLLTGKFKSNFAPSYFDTLAITYTNSSRSYDYVKVTDFAVNGEIQEPNTPPIDGPPPTDDPEGPISLITHLQLDRSGEYRIASNLQAGQLVYTDRNYTYSDVAELAGADFIQTANDHDDFNDTKLFQFQLTAPAHVYILMDASKNNLPTWLNNWALTSIQVTTNDTTFAVYQRSFAANDTVRLGGNAEESGDSMYTVAIQSDSDNSNPPIDPPTEPPTDQQPPITNGPGLGNFNYANNELFKPISIVKSPDGHGNVAMVNGYLMVIYSADGGGTSKNGGIEFWDIADPRKPSLVKRYDNNDTHGLREPHGFGFSNSYGRDLLVAQAIAGIQIWDVSDPEVNIELLSYLDLPGIDEGDYSGNWWVFFQAPYVYIAGTSSGLYIVDATDPFNPTLANHLSNNALGGMNPGMSYALGNLLVLMENDGDKFATLDISNPINPVLIDTFNGKDGYSHLFSGGKILTSGSSSPFQMHVYDVSHSGVINHETSGGDNLGRGGYGSVQDGYFISGFSNKMAKLNIASGAQIGTGTSNIDGRDEDFAVVLGNIVFAGDDHGKGTALIPHQQSADNIPPAVKWIHPRNGASNLATTSRIGVSFSDSVDIETIDAQSFFVRPLGGDALSGKYSVQMGLVNFSPDVPLLANTTYEVIIAGIQDLVGNPSELFTSTFSVGNVTPDNPDDDSNDLLITNITRNYAVVDFSNNALIYTDRSYRFESNIPDSLRGGLLIQTKNNDKNADQADFLRFTINSAADIFVFFDTRTATADIPDWLRSWTKTNLTLATTDVGRVVYRKPFTAGEVTLGGNAPARSMYSVVVKAILPPPSCQLNRIEPVEVAQPVILNAEISGGAVANYQWQVDEASAPIITPEPQLQTEFATAGRYPVVLSVSNTAGSSSCATTVIVHNPLSSIKPVNSATITTNGETVFVVNPDNNSVTKLTSSATVLWEMPAGNNPATLTLTTNGELWVTSRDDSSIRVLNSQSGIESNRIDLPYGARPYGVIQGTDGFIYVTLQSASTLLKLDHSGAILNTLPLPGQPRGIAMTGTGDQLLVTRFLSSTTSAEVYVIDPTDLQLINTLPLAIDLGPDTEASGRGLPNYLTSIAITPDNQSAFIPANKANIERGMFRDDQPLTFDSRVRAMVARIDLATTSENLTARIDLNDRALPQALTFSPLGDLLFVVLQGSNRIEIINAYTSELLGSLQSELAPDGISINTEGTRLYAHNFLSRSVSIYDITELTSGLSHHATLIDTVITVTQEQLPADVLLGKQIFYNAADPRMSRDGYLSCASCHLDGGSDGLVWDFTQLGEGLRNTATLKGKAGTGQGNLHWTANFDEIQDFENDIRFGFGGTGFMPDLAFSMSEAPLGIAKQGLSPDLDALAAYVTSLTKVDASPWRTENGALTPQALQGEQLFLELNCQKCHSGQVFTDTTRHDVGTILRDSGLGHNLPLQGIGIKTPTLLGIWSEAPYLHNGAAKMLADTLVISEHGNAQSLSTEQLDALVAYLRQLDSTSLPPTSPPPDIPSVLTEIRYQFEGTLNDSSGNNLNAIAGNRVSYSTIEMEGEQAVKLEAVEQDHIILPTVVASSVDFSFTGWIRWNGGAPWQRIFSASKDIDNVMFITVADGKGKLRFRIEHEGIKQEIRTNVALEPKRYYHLAVTLNGDIGTVYVNGDVVASSDQISFNPTDLNVTDAWLGKSRFTDPYFDGRLDDIRLFGRALSSMEITTLMMDTR